MCIFASIWGRKDETEQWLPLFRLTLLVLAWGQAQNPEECISLFLFIQSKNYTTIVPAADRKLLSKLDLGLNIVTLAPLWFNMHLNRSGFLIEPFTSRSPFPIQSRPVMTKCCCRLTALLCPVWAVGFSPAAGGQVPELQKPPELTLTGRLCRAVKEWISLADELILSLYALWYFISSKCFTNVS